MNKAMLADDISTTECLEFDLKNCSTGMLVLQPTGFCNIDCRYCYLPDRTKHTKMPDDVVSAAADMLVQNNLLRDHLSVVWHAGEPLVLPASYYDNAMAIVRDKIPDTCKITHYVQTNATLITQEWCDVFSRNDVSVGVSMDGPKQLHDLNRVTRSGAGTYDTVMKGIRLLQKNNINFHIISVLTKRALFFPDEFYAFFVENGIEEVCFNVEEIEGANDQSTLSTNGVEKLYRQFMERFLKLAGAESKIKRLREFAHAYGALFLQNTAEKINDQASPLAIVSVATNGDFSSYSPELLGIVDKRFGDFTLGNVVDNQLCDIIETEKFKSIHTEIAAGVQACQAGCPYFSVCGGGAPANKFFETGQFSSTETLYCKLTVQVVTDIVLKACNDGFTIKDAQTDYPTL